MLELHKNDAFFFNYNNYFPQYMKHINSIPNSISNDIIVLLNADCEIRNSSESCVKLPNLVTVIK